MYEDDGIVYPIGWGDQFIASMAVEGYPIMTLYKSLTLIETEE